MQNKTEMMEYEKNQTFNWIVSYIHSIRYKRLIRFISTLSKNSQGEKLKIIDIGCCYAKTFELLDKRFNIDYLGIELDESFSKVAYERYKSNENFRIINDSVENHYSKFSEADVIIALETLEHIPEHIVVRLVEQIALAKPKAFICSVPNEVGPIVFLKNISSLLMGYMRHTEYKWKETLYAGFFKLDKIEPHGVGHKGFDWRWLAQTIRHNMKISHTYSSPISGLPKTLSVSIMFFCLRED